MRAKYLLLMKWPFLSLNRLFSLFLQNPRHFYYFSFWKNKHLEFLSDMNTLTIFFSVSNNWFFKNRLVFGVLSYRSTCVSFKTSETNTSCLRFWNVLFIVPYSNNHNNLILDDDSWDWQGYSRALNGRPRKKLIFLTLVISRMSETYLLK